MDQNIRSSSLVGVTILRPLKGIDAEMETCLRSSFEQDYPKDKLEIIFCVQSASDASIGVVRKLIEEYPEIDAKLMIDQQSGTTDTTDNYGPNPKINNLAKGYKVAKFDTLWVIDSNAWARPDTLKRSVYTLTNNLHNGARVHGKKRVLMVNHTPLAVALDEKSPGSRLDEMFLSTSHAKFYISLNTLAIAPCINGKSTIYRRSDLDTAVRRMGKKATFPSRDGLSGDLYRDAAYYGQRSGEGIRLFARYIGEDNMIGIALWDYVDGRAGMSADAVVQPLGGNNTIRDYMNRRMRWLRVRKYMVLAATLVEPTTECIVAGLIGTFSLSVLFWNCNFRKLYFVMHVLVWFIIDYIQFNFLHYGMESPVYDSNGREYGLPPFLSKNVDLRSKIPYTSIPVKSLKQFISVWIQREILAFPIWVMAMLGSSIDWRGQPFRIKADLTAERLPDEYS